MRETKMTTAASFDFARQVSNMQALTLALGSLQNLLSLPQQGADDDNDKNNPATTKGKFFFC